MLTGWSLVRIRPGEPVHIDITALFAIFEYLAPTLPLRELLALASPLPAALVNRGYRRGEQFKKDWETSPVAVNA